MKKNKLIHMLWQKKYRLLLRGGIFILLFGLLSFSAVAQNTPRTVNGRITDETGAGLVGASIVLKGTTIGTVADDNGDFKFELPATVSDKGSLVFSSVGFLTQEIELGTQTNFNVRLANNEALLEEAVVVAFAQQKKVTVTGAIVSIQTKEIKQSPAANLAVSLAGRLPGLTAIQRSGEPGRDATQLFIRGQGTTNGQAPLVLVDGVERELTYIDPNEVASVTVLKDASSTAIFGIRGANGVILVTTRRGVSETPQINFSTEVGLTDFTRIARNVDAYGYATLRTLAEKNDGITALTYTPEAIEAFRTGSDPKRYPNTDWLDVLTNKYSMQKRYNLNISGAGKSVKYFVNAGLLDQDGQFKTEKGLKYDPKFNLKRYNFRSNVDIQVTKNLKTFLNIAGYLENQNGPFAVAAANDGQGGSSPSLFVLANIFDMPSTIPGPLSPDGIPTTKAGLVNVPYGQLNRSGYRQQTRSNVAATYGMEQDLSSITPGLAVKAIMSFDSRATNTLNASKAFTRSILTFAPGLKDREGKDSVYYAPYAADQRETPLSITGNTGFTSQTNIQGYITYNRTFGKNALSGLLLYNQQKNIQGAELPFNLRGLSSRITYGFDDKYFGEFSAGYNGSEQFAKGKRFGFFPAISAGWVLSNEPFLKTSKSINLLKLRGSYGLVGNDRLGGSRFLYLDNIQVGSGGYSSSLGLGQVINTNLLKNEDLTWEVSKKANIGIEVGFLNSFNLIIDLFSENRDNILRNRGTIPSLNGLPSNVLPPANVGVISNKGYEVELNYKKSFNKDFNIQSRLNVSYARNFQNNVDEAQQPADFAYRYRQNGYRIGQYFGYITEKYFDNVDEIAKSPSQTSLGGVTRPGDFKYKDLNNDGKIDNKDQAPIGYSNVPEYTFGAAFSTGYKNFDLSVLFQGVSNFTYRFQGRGTVAGVNYVNRHLESWTEERLAKGEAINYPRISISANQNEIANDFFTVDASFLRVKNLEIGYTFPTKLSSKIRSKGMRLYANALNVFTWDRLPTKDFDPEQNSDLAYPVSRTYNFGINVTF
jgi:TonB-linked SusC/RagA family outer membrane protein